MSKELVMNVLCITGFLLAALAIRSDAFYTNSVRCSSYDPTRSTRCNVTDLCALEGDELDGAVACLRENILWSARGKMLACDADGTVTCIDAAHCVDVALAACDDTCPIEPAILTKWGCKRECNYTFLEKLVECPGSYLF